MRLLNVVIGCLMLALAAGASAQTTFTNPTYNGMPVDRCWKFCMDCDEYAASRWCQLKGYGEATDFKTGSRGPTYIIGDKQVCDENYCSSFTSITCGGGSSSSDRSSNQGSARSGSGGSGSRSSSSSSSSLTFEVENYTGLSLNLQFKDKDRTKVWPANDRIYGVTPGGSYISLSCERGEYVCFGIWDDSQRWEWGAGYDVAGSCSDCCYRCDGQTVGFNLR